MEMDWLTPQEAGKLWNITERRVQSLCTQEQIEGAIKKGRMWLIPKSSQKPVDGRTKAAKKEKIYNEN